MKKMFGATTREKQKSTQQGDNRKSRSLIRVVEFFDKPRLFRLLDHVS
jgi:hypothetical protein